MDAGTVFVCDAAQLVDACYQGTDEAEVDEGDEASIVSGPVVCEEGCDGPGGAEDTDDEEDEDVGWCQGVVARVDVHEVGKHAEGGDLGEDVIS